MNNYVIFKGIDSRTIRGLIIQELPSITKPKMRVSETVIDGVDGSYIEELGYESYDKTFKIGLTRNYDIDEVIDYFNGEGSIVFSNEPDKYYKVKIINQINYERLVRFKEATVKIRTQPFKYLYQEHKQVFSNPTESITVINNGFLDSKPIIKLEGSGTIEFKIDNVAIFSYTFPNNESEVIIDSDKQDAYLGNILKNRNMNGEFPLLKRGKNIITWTGTITKIEVIANSRWL